LPENYGKLLDSLLKGYTGLFKIITQEKNQATLQFSSVDKAKIAVASLDGCKVDSSGRELQVQFK
jgi:hypothetical protein